MADLILRSLTQMWENFFSMFMQFLPRLLALLIIVVAGWFIATILKVVLRRILLWVDFNTVCERAGAAQLLRKAALPAPVDLLSRLVFWVVWVGFLLLGITALGIMALQDQVSRFFLFLPQIFVALLVLFLGLLAANFFSRATLLAAVNANFPSARLLSNVVRFIIIFLAVTMALEQIALAHHAVLIAFAIAFGAVMLGLAIAFGIGGQHAARRLLENQLLEQEKEKQEEISSL